MAWRAEYPCAAVGGKMEIIPEQDFVDVVTWPRDEPPLRWQLHQHSVDQSRIIKSRTEYETWIESTPDWASRIVYSEALFPDHNGVAVWTRPCLARATLAESMRHQHGIRTIAELDDNYIMPSQRQNLFLRSQNFGKPGKIAHLKAICSMNAIVFSTQWLLDYYEKRIRQRFGDVPGLELYVCGNHVPAAVWPERVERDGPIRVGWMGSPSHIWDVHLAWNAMLWASQHGAETWMIGYNPVTDGQDKVKVTVDGKDLVDKRRLNKTAQKVSQWERVGFKHIPWRQPAQFERFALPLDIGLCPLRTNPHTLGKSDIKAIEYVISGAAVIAQRNGVYKQNWIHGETALLADSPEDFLKYTDLLMRDENLRLRLVENGQQYVRENRSDKQLKAEWTAAIHG